MDQDSRDKPEAGQSVLSVSQPRNTDIEDPEKAPPANDQTSTTDDHEYVTGIRLVLILAATTLVYFLIMLDGSIVATAIPKITTEFHSLLDVGWYGSAYQLANASLQPLSGKIYTYFTTKWSFLTFFAIFQLGSLLCGVATSTVMLIVGRAVAGMGASGLMNGAFTILAACVPVPKQPALMGVLIAIGQLGIAFGPLIGGAFTQYATWRWCFYINLPIGVLAGAFLVFIYIPERGTKPPFRTVLGTAIESLDLLGFTIFAPASIMFLLALQYGGNQYAWDSATVIGLLCGAAATFAIFLLWEHRKGDDAMIPFSMISQRILWSASATMFFFLGALFCSNYYLPIYFQAVKDASPTMSGVDILPTILSQVLMAMVSGIMVQRLGYYLPWVLVGSSMTAVAYGLYSRITPSTPTAEWVGYQILFGLGCGSGVTISFIAVQNLVAPEKIPIAMGVLVFCQNFGGALWLDVAQTIFTNSLVSSLRTYAPGVNPAAVVQAGARGIRSVVSQDQLAGVLKAYSKGVDNVMYLGIGLSIAAFCFAWGLGWKDIRKAKTEKPSA